MHTIKNELSNYFIYFKKELIENILPFWMKYGIEKKGLGFYGAVDLAGNPVVSANKSIVLNARILWTFSAAASLYKNEEYAAVADKAYKVVTEDFEDKVYGGYFMELSADNKVVNDIKHTYAQAFVVYALCKYYELHRQDKVMQKIQDLFSLLETKARDTEHLGYLESFSRDWQVIQENRMADNNEPKTMNTHLHVLEAWTELFKIWKDKLVENRLSEMINLFIDNIIRKNGHLGIFFDKDFNEAESSKGICSFGHEIEGSWLLWEASETINNKEIKNKMFPLVIKMVDNIERVAVDKDGGLFLESTRFGSHVKTNKHWWQQAETLVGFMNAFQLTGDTKYWDTVKLSWNFINTYLIDHEKGEWFTKLNRLGVPFKIEPPDDPSPYYRNDWKIDPWKCPYHNGRAMMEMMRRIEKIN